MKTTKALLIILLILSFCLVSCEVSETSETANENTETNDISETEDFTWAYPSVVEVETDLADTDYSKFIFVSDFLHIDSDKELNVGNYEEARQMLKAAEAHSGERLNAANHDEALNLLKEIIDNSADKEYKLMVSVSFTDKATGGGYYVDTRYSECYKMYLNSGERQDLLFYSKKHLDHLITPEALLKAWERFTKYSKITSITFYTVPVVNVTG